MDSSFRPRLEARSLKPNGQLEGFRPENPRRRRPHQPKDSQTTLDFGAYTRKPEVPYPRKKKRISTLNPFSLCLSLPLKSQPPN